MTLGGGFVIWHELIQHTTDSVSATIYAIMRGLVIAISASARISCHNTETARHTMILAGMLEEKLKEMDRAVSEARAKNNARWQR